MKNSIFAGIFLTLALPIYCMEDPRDHQDSSNNINQSNTQAHDEDLLHNIGKHSVELLDEILNLLPVDDEGYNSVKQHIRLPMSETTANRIAEQLL